MRRKLVVSLLLVALLALAATIAWTLLGWPPPRLVLKYGIPPYCEPTGETMTVEGIEFVEIGPGCFRMGSEYLAQGGDFLGKMCAKFGLPWGTQPKPSNEMPVHWVEFESAYWIMRTEVTNASYAAFCPTHSRVEGAAGDQHPVANVSWVEATCFAEWLAEKTGLPLRLPTESEWESACRAGSSAEFCFGDDESQIKQYAETRADSSARGFVASRLPNEWGLFDLHGSVYEWCQDEYHHCYIGAPSSGEAWIGSGRRGVVCRGGAWVDRPATARSAWRGMYGVDVREDFIGFRLAFQAAPDLDAPSSLQQGPR